MKQLIYALSVAAMAMVCNDVAAQSTTYINKDVKTGYSMDALPGTPFYISGGTVYDPAGDNKIDLFMYDIMGNPPSPFFPLTVDEQGTDNRCIKVISINPQEFLVVAFSQPIGSAQSFVHLLRMDINGNISMQEKYMSADPFYYSLFPTDAIINFNSNEVLICGAATSSPDCSPTSPKQAFVMRVDLGSFGFINMNFYDSNSGGGTDDNDIASKIIQTSAGDYYVCGSENVFKLNTYHTMGIRNMRIDPNLNVLWSFPLSLFTDLKENSVDMQEMVPVPPALPYYAVLINFTQSNTWGILRIDPNSGSPTTPTLEQDLTLGTAFCFLTPNTPDEVLVAGMKPAAVSPSNCTTMFPDQANPFFAFIKMNSYPGTMYYRTEYMSAQGNYIPGILRYWDIGGFYAVYNGYGLPSFLNKFPAREQNMPGTNMAVNSPIVDFPSPYLNPKFTFTDPMGNTGCPQTVCPNGLARSPRIYFPSTSTSWMPSFAFPIGSGAFVNFYLPLAVGNCPGYYKTANPDNGSNTGISSASEALVYPNPTSSALNINLSGYADKHVQIELYNLVGEHIATIFNGPAQATVNYTLPEGIARGLYTISIEASGMDKRIEKISVQ